MQNSPKDLRKKILGRRGEDLTKKYLEKRGYKIVERNFSTPFGEADIIAEKGGILCFVEVKTRSGDGFGKPFEAVDARKQERYRKIAAFYLAGVYKEERECRFDVSSVENGKIEYIEDAFQ